MTPFSASLDGPVGELTKAKPKEKRFQLDANASTHQNAIVRTTIDIPDDLYRTLKARSGLSGVPLRELVRRLIEQGLRSSTGEAQPRQDFGPPPVIIPARGKPILALPRAELRRMEAEEDEVKHARST
jgi:hypothetical protein